MLVKITFFYYYFLYIFFNYKSTFSGTEIQKRPNSTEIDFTGCDDLFVIQACWEVILSFMGDSNFDILGKVTLLNLIYFRRKVVLTVL